MENHIDKLVHLKISIQKNIKSHTISLEQRNSDINNLVKFLGEYCAQYSSSSVEYLFTVKKSLVMNIVIIKNTLERHNNELTIVLQLIKECCKHEWINDYIDIDVEKTQQITYCKVCESSRY